MRNPFKRFDDETRLGLTIDDPNDVVPDQELPEVEFEGGEEEYGDEVS